MRLSLASLVVPAVLAVTASHADAGPPSSLVQAAPGRLVLPTLAHRRATSFSGPVPPDAVALPNGGLLVLAPVPAGLSLVRLRFDGTPEPSFGRGGQVTVATPDAVLASGSFQPQLLRRPDGRLVLTTTTARGGLPFLTLIGLTEQGAPDLAFHHGEPLVTALSVPLEAAGHLAALTPGGGIVVTGQRYPVGEVGRGDAGFSPLRWLVGKVLADGEPDPAFGDGSVATMPETGAGGLTVAVAADGVVLTVGTTTFGPTLLRRLTPTGRIDPGFHGGEPIPVGAGNGTHVTLPQPGGAVDVVVRDQAGARLVRFARDGTVDPAYGQDGAIALPATGYDPVPVSPFTGDGGEVVVLPPALGTASLTPGLADVEVLRVSAAGRLVDDRRVVVGLAGGYGVGGDELSWGPGTLTQSAATLAPIGLDAGGTLLLAGTVSVAQVQDHYGATTATDTPALVALAPAGDLDRSFVAPAPQQAPPIAVRADPQRAAPLRAGRAQGLHLRFSGPGAGLARVRVTAGGATLVDSVQPVFGGGDQRLLAPVPYTDRAGLKRNLPFRVTVTFRDLLGAPARATARGRLR